MKREWDGQRRRTPEQQQQRRFRAAIQAIPWHGRLDVILVGGLTVMLALLAISGYLGIQYADRAGWFDPPLVEQIADDRILTNIRTHIAEQPLLDAVWHQPDGAVVIAQTGGAFHSYDPATGLWFTERPFSDADAIQPDFTLLRSGCGEHPLAEGGHECADPNSLWAVSATGGLARKLNGRWNIVVADSSFLGADGQLVEQEQLTAAAVSDDQAWLVVGTRGNGIGLYDIAHHRWLPVPAGVQGALPALAVSHVAWADGAFWVGGPQGVAKVTLTRSAPAVEAGVFPPLELIDMDANGDGLWVLGRRACAETGAGCLWLGYLPAGATAPRELMVEEAIYPQLNANELFFAQMWGEDLVVAGPAGIYQYAPARHSWRQLFAAAVTTVLPLSKAQGGEPGGEPGAEPGNPPGFYFGYSGGAGLAAPVSETSDGESATRLWPLENEVVVQMALLANQPATADQDALALTASGKAIALGSDGSTVPVYTPETTQFDPDLFHAAIAAGDKLAFVSSEGVLIHDLVARTYRDLPAADLPLWLTAASTRFVTSGARLFALAEPARSRVAVYSLLLAQIVEPDFLRQEAAKLTAESVPGPVSKVWAWEANSLGLLDGSGSIERLGSGAAQRLTGPRQSAFDLDDFRDVAELNDGLIVATDDGLQRYDMPQRAWSALTMPAGYGAPAELAVFGGALYVRTANGQLIRPEQNPAPVIGDRRGFSLAPAELSDALLQDGMLYHAGAGRVERYNLALRRIDATWQLSGGEAVSLVAIVEGKPLALNSQRAYWGEQELDAGAGPVLGLSLSADTIWTVRSTGGARYLKGYPLAQPSVDAATCFFRQPTAGADVTTVRDALRLPNGWIAAATDAGLRFYSLEQRSWRSTRSSLITPDRLYLTRRYLILVQERAQESAQESAIAFVPLNSLNFPASCAGGAVDFQHTSLAARAIAVDPSRDLAAWLQTDGSLHEWQDGQERLLLAAGGQGPAAGDWQRIFEHDGYLLAVAGGELWRYSLATHAWAKIALRLPAGAAAATITDMDAEATADGDMLSVVAGGKFYSGLLANDAGAATLAAATTGNPGQPFGADSAQILDIQNRSDGLWTFLLTDRIKYFDPVRRTWRADALLGAADPSLELRQVLGRSVAVGDEGQTWWIAQGAGAAPRDFAPLTLRPDAQHALDSQGNAWSLDGAGQLQKCAAQDGQYVCTPAAPAPFYLDPNGIEQAYQWDNLIIFATRDGLRAFDTAARAEAVLPPAAGSFGGVHQAQVVAGELWLLGHPGLLMLRRSQDVGAAGLTGELVGGADAVVADRTSRLWAHFATGWRQWQGSEFVAPLLADGRVLAEAGVRLLLVEGGSPIGYDGAGYVYTQSGAAFVRSDLPLPPSLIGRRLTALVPGETDELWLVADDGEWHHIAASRCAPPAPPAPPTPEPLAGASMISEPLPLTGTLPLTGALDLTGTLSVTPTPTLTPTPAPEPIPCLVDVNHQPLPVEFAAGLAGAAPPALAGEPVAAAYVPGRGLELINGVGVGLRLQSRPTYSATIYTAPPLQRQAADRWREFQANVAVLSNGRSAYAPITALAVQNGALVANRPGYPHQLAPSAALALELPPALDAGWLRWNRGQASATVATPTGAATLPARDLAQNGRLLFEGVESLLAAASDRFYAATPRGVWLHTTADLRLDDPNIQVALATIQPPIRAAHGRFYAANGVFRPDGQQDGSALATWTIRLGSVELSEAVTAQRVTGRLPIGTQTVSPFAARGFLWDTGRRSLAYANGKLMLLTAAGIHAAGNWHAFDPGPPAVARGEGRLLRGADQQLYLAAGESPLFYAAANDWQGQSRDPNADRTLFTDATWSWRISQGEVHVELAADAHQFGISRSGGFGFTSDTLQFASAHANSFFVMSQAFLETAAQAGELAALSAPRSAPALTERLDVVRFVSGPPQLYRTNGGAVTRWDPTRRQFTAVATADNPVAHLVRVQDSRLRYTRLGERVLMELRVDDTAGVATWATMTWQDGQFPFDVVTAVAVHDGQLYVGSAAGLQVFANGLNLDIRSAAAVFDLRSGGETLAAVSRLGAPMSQPNLLQVWADARCVQRQDQGVFRPCADPSLLDRRLRVRNSFWEWEADAAGALTGTYLSASAARLPVTFDGGRLGHDNIGDVAACAGLTATRWGRNWVTVHSGAEVALDGSQRTLDRGAEGAIAFLCVPNSLHTATTEVAAGLYLLGRNGRYWRYAPNGWLPAGDRSVDLALADYAAHPPVYQQERLRLVKPAAAGRYTLEQRRLDLTWRPLAWISNPTQGGYQVSIDQWDSIVGRSGQLWSATPGGLVALAAPGSSPGSSTVRLDPRQLHVVPITAETPAGCRVSDMEVLDGVVMLRCAADSARVFAGDLTLAQDAAVFALHAGPDPFAARTWIAPEAGRWATWQLEGRQGGAAGHLTGQLCLATAESATAESATAESAAAESAAAESAAGVQCQDAISLGGGRFQFDTLNSMALTAGSSALRLLLATDAGGWFAYPAQDLHLSAAVRPAYAGVDALAVDHVGYTLGSQDDPRLCVAQKDGSFIVLNSDGETDQPGSCPEYLGRDTLWRYSVLDGALVIEARLAGAGGFGRRVLAAGRFADDQIVGPPVTSGQAESFYLLPTAAGTVELDRDLDARRIHVGEFPGLDPGSAPTALYLWEPGAPVYWAADGFHALEGEREVAYPLAVQGRGGQPRAVSAGPQRTLMVTWPRTAGGWQEWALVDAAGVPSGAGQAAGNELAIPVGEIKAYRSHRSLWGNPPAWLTIRLNPAVLEAIGPAREGVKTALAADFVLLAAVPAQDRLLLIGSTDLLAVDLNQLIVDAFGAPAKPPPPVPAQATRGAALLTLEPAAPTATAPPRPTTLSLATPTPPLATPAPAVTMLPQPTPAAVGRVTSAGLNVRAGPGVSYGVLAVVRQDELLTVLGKWHANNWLLVETSTDRQGWVAGEFVALTGCVECVPLITENGLVQD